MAQVKPSPICATQALSPSIRLLENGDRLTRCEFERRYEAMKDLKKAELIDGIVYIPLPPRYQRHARPHAYLGGWIGQYMSETPGVDGATNATLRLDEDNEPQPDLILRIDQSKGGRSRVSEDDYLEGPVELVAEVAGSSISIDAHAKFNLYRRHGIAEYLIWRVDDAAIDWFILREGHYVRLEPGADGIIRSETFPGLWLDPAALIRGDLPRVFEIVNAGADTPEHEAFCSRLAGKS
jgi:Uma2 family endonuclease